MVSGEGAAVPLRKGSQGSSSLCLPFLKSHSDSALIWRAASTWWGSCPFAHLRCHTGRLWTAPSLPATGASSSARRPRWAESRHREDWPTGGPAGNAGWGQRPAVALKTEEVSAWLLTVRALGIWRVGGRALSEGTCPRACCAELGAFPASGLWEVPSLPEALCALGHSSA